MADIHSKETRSYNMSRIAGKNTAPEMLVRRFLHGLGYRYGLHSKTLPGKPDIVLTRYKTIINVHGCFWHGHENCRYYSVPKTRRKWWSDKINGNIRNDEKTELLLRKAGWKVITIWGCELKSLTMEKTLSKLAKRLEKLK
ncbi:MAG: DNA mismatch endonuclease Vsr [Ferruginibacter sp.]